MHRGDADHGGARPAYLGVERAPEAQIGERDAHGRALRAPRRCTPCRAVRCGRTDRARTVRWRERAAAAERSWLMLQNLTYRSSIRGIPGRRHRRVGASPAHGRRLDRCRRVDRLDRGHAPSVVRRRRAVAAAARQPRDSGVSQRSSRASAASISCTSSSRRRMGTRSPNTRRRSTPGSTGFAARPRSPGWTPAPSDRTRSFDWLANRQLLVLHDRYLDEALRRLGDTGMPAAIAARRDLLALPSSDVAADRAPGSGRAVRSPARCGRWREARQPR